MRETGRLVLVLTLISTVAGFALALTHELTKERIENARKEYELKAVKKFDPIHEAQLLSYLKLSGCRVGLLINFNVKLLKQGIRRMVNDLD